MRICTVIMTSAALFVLFGQALASSLGDTFGAVSFLNLKGILDIIAACWLSCCFMEYPSHGRTFKRINPLMMPAHTRRGMKHVCI